MLGCRRDRLAPLPHGRPRSCGTPLGFCSLPSCPPWGLYFSSACLALGSPSGVGSIPHKLGLSSKCGLRWGAQAWGLAWVQPPFQPRQLQAHPGGASGQAELRNCLSQSCTRPLPGFYLTTWGPSRQGEPGSLGLSGVPQPQARKAPSSPRGDVLQQKPHASCSRAAPCPFPRAPGGLAHPLGLEKHFCGALGRNAGMQGISRHRRWLLV